MDFFLNIKWDDVGQTIIRGVIALVVLFAITRLMGKKQISQLSLFDYTIGISIGNFAAEAAMNLDNHAINGLVSIVLFGGLAWLISIVQIHSFSARRFFTGVPTVVIQDGKILEKMIKKSNITINDVLQHARTAGHFDIAEVAYAILESNGTMSFLPKGKHKPVTMQDLKLAPDKPGLCANVIEDRIIMKDNLKNVNKDKEWLLKELGKQGYASEKDVFLATVDVNKNVVVYVKNPHTEAKGVLE